LQNDEVKTELEREIERVEITVKRMESRGQFDTAHHQHLAGLKKKAELSAKGKVSNAEQII
jgi:hypothetical protein